jgi:hypothetical protein
MSEEVKYYVHCQFQDNLNKLLTQVKDLFEKSGYHPPEAQSEPVNTADLKAAFSETLAATALEFQDQINKLLAQVKNLWETPGGHHPEEYDRLANTAAAMNAFSAVLAATAAEPGLWCKNVNQNGAANKSNIQPRHKEFRYPAP